MECGKITATADHSNISTRGHNSGPMVPCELEAAEALAGLAGFRLLRREMEGELLLSSPQDQPKNTNPEKIDKVDENVPSIFCNEQPRSNSNGKLRQKLTEAEKEDRKLRRIMANRESARQTIHRRQVMHQELIRKADDVSEENKVLKKKKELVIEEYNSLKSRNAYLKALLEKVKTTTRGKIQEEPKISQQNNPTDADTNNPILTHNHPPLLPCFWPSLIPSPDFFPFPRASGSSAISSHPGHENLTPPLVVVAVPCLLPFLACSSTPDSHSTLNNGQNTHHPMSSDRNMNAAESGRTTYSATGITSPPNSTGPCASNVHVGVSRSVKPAVGNSESDDSCIANTRLGMRSVRKAEDSFAATEARRRRKELMLLKNIDRHHNVQLR